MALGRRQDRLLAGGRRKFLLERPLVGGRSSSWHEAGAAPGRRQERLLAGDRTGFWQEGESAPGRSRSSSWQEQERLLWRHERLLAGAGAALGRRQERLLAGAAPDRSRNGRRGTWQDTGSRVSGQ
jgi:hypothetical protein